MGVAGDGVTTRLALLLALSVHSVMEGLGLGARSSKAWNLLFAIFIHKVHPRGGEGKIILVASCTTYNVHDRVYTRTFRTTRIRDNM